MKHAIFCLFFLLTAGFANSDPASPPPPAWALPGFHGDGRAVEPPGGALEPPRAGAGDARALYDLVLTCLPRRSWFKPELALQVRGSNQRRSNSADPATGDITSTSGSYAALILTVPLYSAAEIDREWDREKARRTDAATAVGALEKLIAARGVLRRELDLWRAVETRSGRRVSLGVAETQEQITAIQKVADVENQLRANRADLTAQALGLAGMCADRADIEAAVSAAIGERR